MRLAERSVRSASALLVGGVGLCVLVACVALLRLNQGPVSLPFLVEPFETRIAAELAGRDVQIGDVVFALGSEGTPSGLRVRDVVLRDTEGQKVFVAPELGARFRVSDAIEGAFAPTELFLTGAEGRIIRETSGEFRVEFLPKRREGSDADENVDAADFQTLIETLERNEIPLVRNLRSIRIHDISMTYMDERSGRNWHTDSADLTVTRWPNAIQARLTVDVSSPEAGETARMTLHGKRVFGEDTTDFTATFEGVRPSELAAQSPDLAFLENVNLPASGQLTVSVYPDGRLSGLEGRIELRPGASRFRGQRLDVAGGAIELRYDKVADRLDVPHLSVAGDTLALQGQGHIKFVRDEGGGVTALLPSFEAKDLTIDPSGLFGAPVTFRSASLAARIIPDALRVNLHHLTLEGANETLRVTGRASRETDGWAVDMTARARNISTLRLVELWPVASAPGARTWVDKYMPAGVVTSVEAAFGLQDGVPEFGLDFAFDNALAYPVPTMPPIENGAGTGRLDLKTFTLTLAEGTVQPDGFKPVDLTGSVFHIPDITKKPADADVSLKGTGPIASVMAVLDEPPLGFLKRVNITPQFATGDAVVDARLAFPMRKKLTPGEVSANATATLTNVRVKSPISDLPVRAGKLSLVADNRSLTVKGPVRLGDTGARVTWTEIFVPGPKKPRSDVSATFNLDPGLLSALNANSLAEMVSGPVPTTLKAQLFRKAAPAFTLTAGLTDAAMKVPQIGWVKPAGTKGRLTLSGRLVDGVTLNAIDLTAGDLALAGGIEIAPGGGLRSARFKTLRLGEAIDSSLTVTNRSGKLTYRISGGQINLAEIGRVLSTETNTSPYAGEDAPELEIDVDRLILSRKLQLVPAQGRYVSDNEHGRALNFLGKINGGTDAQLLLSHGDEGLEIRLMSEDAGGLLRDAGYFSSGFGGRLLLLIHPKPGQAELKGRFVVRRIKVKNAPVLSRIFSVASVTGVLETLSTGGLTFDRIDAPFVMRDGILYLERTVAIGASIGLSVEGAYDEAQDALDLSGVFSPAFLLNGLLSDVPLLGNVLTSKRGEGVFGFSYQVSGSTKNPDVSVNPLSVLAPGMLRRVFDAEINIEASTASQDVPLSTQPVEAKPDVSVPSPATVPEPESDRDLYDR